MDGTKRRTGPHHRVAHIHRFVREDKSEGEEDGGGERERDGDADRCHLLLENEVFDLLTFSAQVGFLSFHGKGAI